MLALTHVASASEILGIALGTETLLVVVVVAWVVSCPVGFLMLQWAAERVSDSNALYPHLQR